MAAAQGEDVVSEVGYEPTPGKPASDQITAVKRTTHRAIAVMINPSHAIHADVLDTKQSCVHMTTGTRKSAKKRVPDQILVSAAI